MTPLQPPYEIINVSHRFRKFYSVFCACPSANVFAETMFFVSILLLIFLLTVLFFYGHPSADGYVFPTHLFADVFADDSVC